MHSKLGLWVLTLGVTLSVVGCGSPPPTAAIDAAKAALDKATAAGASQYTPDLLKAAQDAQAALDAELKVQEGGWFKSYTKASQLAAAAQKAAETALADATAWKAKAKADANTAIGAAKKVLAEAQELLAKAPKGKGSAADLEAMKTDLTNASNAIADAEKAAAGERFLDASAKAESANKAATTVKTAVEEAIAAKKKK
jgi:hypothetical protein